MHKLSQYKTHIFLYNVLPPISKGKRHQFIFTFANIEKQFVYSA